MKVLSNFFLCRNFRKTAYFVVKVSSQEKNQSGGGGAIRQKCTEQIEDYR